MKEHGAYSATEAASYEVDREIEPLWHIENEYVRNLVTQVHGLSILDVPVGTGRFLKFYGDQKVTGIDLSEAMLLKAHERARALGMHEITLLNSSVTELPFADNEFDHVICWRLLHLLPPESLAPALASMARVCRGTLCVQIYERASFSQRTLAKVSRWIRRIGIIAAGKRHLTPWSHIHVYSYSREDIDLAAKVAGIGPPVRRDHLGRYEGTNVIALQWIRQ